MPDARPSVEPLSAGESSESDEVYRLQLQSQRQLEDDIARIFDESIYSDLEVVCGKLKILTHSCILKARTHKFYHKLEAILHVNIGHNTFDEIYSFISDTYTECNIQQEEGKIIDYLNKNVNIAKGLNNSLQNKSKKKSEAEVYLTPNCVSPVEKNSQKTLSSSPSTELTKEYYALVPLEGNVLDRELIEQDVLSNAFQSINKSQNKSSIHCIKPTSLCLNYSSISRKTTHSLNCDILKKTVSNNDLVKKVIGIDEISVNNSTTQTLKTFQKSEADKTSTVYNKAPNLSETSVEKGLDSTYTPDSLITDEPSSSSDYLSATYVVSPGTVFSSGCSRLNVGENCTKMENVVTISDSGLETPGMLESLNSHKDVTVADVSLTDSTIRDMINDDNTYQDLASNSLDKGNTSKVKDINDQRVGKAFLEMNNTSTKEEKQRHNEEIVIMESSSLSSETGSWESVFPPKLSEKELCVRFIANELKNALEEETKKNNTSAKQHDDLCPSLVQKSPYKSSCFIDAASLADECGEVLSVRNPITETNLSRTDMVEQNQTILRRDLSPSDWSGSNDNEDSLEQTDNKEESHSIQKCISPTKYVMPSITENTSGTFDSKIYKIGEHIEDIALTEENDLSGNGFIQVPRISDRNSAADTTPNNSIISVKHNSDSRFGDDLLNARVDCDDLDIFETAREFNCSSSSMSYVPFGEDEPLTASNDHNLSLSDMAVRKKNENKPIVSGAYIPEQEHITEKPPRAPLNSSFWVVDMSSNSIQSDSECKLNSEPVDELRSTSKSESRKNGKVRSSVDSDSSEKSTHNFYIDLSTLPDVLTPDQKHNKDEGSEKKNMFSMFVDLGDSFAIAKDMPPRFSSTPNTKKNTRAETKCSNKGPRTGESKSTKSVTQTSDDTLFEKLETLCNDPSINISEIMNRPNEISKLYNDLKNKMIQEEPASEESLDMFVKLSDLDKPAPKVDPVINSDNIESERMTRSIPDNDWRESSQTIDIRSSEIISSFHSENALSLNRLFPNLKNVLSKSMPGSLSSRTRSPLRHGVSSSPGDINEHQASDVSEMSSVQSSYSRSVVENSTTEETEQTSSLINNCQSRLGQDLLRMFLEEIAPDVIVEVSGRRIKAHKCILSSRCQYFAGILSGGWVKSAGNVISLPPFRFSVVHFALCHIYSGVSVIPDSINIMELATLADMLGLEGLKEGIMFMLKAKYCHHFHKPCELCTAGVLECLTLSSAYGLDDLYHKCLRWINKYFRQVWPTKAFTSLPAELIAKCCDEQIINLCTENLVDVVFGVGVIMWSLGKRPWAVVVARICECVVTEAARFTAKHLCEVLSTMHSMPPPDDLPPAAWQRLHDCLEVALEIAPVEQTCRAYMMVCPLEDGSDTTRSLLTTQAVFLRMLCERLLVRNAPRVVNTNAFCELPDELRYRLRSLGCITFGKTASATYSEWLPRPVRGARAAPPPSSALATPRSLDIDLVRTRCLPNTQTPQPHLGSVDSLSGRDKTAPPRTARLRDDRPDSKMLKTYPPSVRSTKAQEERTKYNSIKTNQATEVQRTRPARAAYEHTKPRYMEPRQPRAKPVAAGAPRKPHAKKVSSSESSRNSSPLPRPGRASRPQPAAAPARPRPRTALPSTDLTTDKYKTYTKARHNTEGTVEAVSVSAEAHSAPTSSVSLPVAVAHSKLTAKPSKIPVSTTNNKTKMLKDKQRRIQNVTKNPPPMMQANKPNERKPSGSLMSATKSSQAKIVSKTIKETANAKHASNQDRNQIERPSTSKEAVVRSPAGEICVMERSGTFLKDEPTLDITKNIDIDE